ncbi:MAG: CAP domain-containing protein [Alphaproteobacteria bacterium]|uniref:CAP domain-containing protein n=1 Tax=Peteryoungia algae TaxID=2919917 RepID=A0ABT0CVJ7_9HYPH|nr:MULTISPECIES: CAP domain-containing protein [unclassified Rhizobium]MBU2328276.1 CAP domain-containing protein [Alphaproteobacteria bacterium]MCC8931563.1 CAP domain-containing protein [Rhizobium sp. 'Codium 1']MCJ8237192.1 CAP domain-containing protein [Rhizobium sp. SSM4.3]
MAEITLPRRRLLLISAGLLTATIAGCRSTDILNPGEGQSRAETAAALPLVNRLRQSRGLSSLSRGRSAEVAAVAQAKRMARAGQMSHLIGFNDSFGARMKGHDVPLPAAENIAAGQDTVERAVQAWIDSKRHLDNMLGGFNGLGVAVAWDSSSGNRPYWAMVLSA